eukprot:3404937-Prymnesium_polylepis.3
MAEANERRAERDLSPFATYSAAIGLITTEREARELNDANEARQRLNLSPFAALPAANNWMRVHQAQERNAARSQQGE